MRNLSLRDLLGLEFRPIVQTFQLTSELIKSREVKGLYQSMFSTELEVKLNLLSLIPVHYYIKIQSLSNQNIKYAIDLSSNPDNLIIMCF